MNSDCEYTSEEMSSECGENESNKDEDEAQCLEVDDPEIDDIMREVTSLNCEPTVLHTHT